MNFEKYGVFQGWKEGEGVLVLMLALYRSNMVSSRHVRMYYV